MVVSIDMEAKLILYLDSSWTEEDDTQESKKIHIIDTCSDQ